MKKRIAVRGIATRGNKILCVRHRLFEDPTAVQDFWALPGGGLDENEPVLTGIEREFIEETGIKPEVGDLLYVHQFCVDGCESLELFFHIKNSRDYLNVDLSTTSHGHIEIAEIDFIDPTQANIRPRFLASDKVHEFAGMGAAARLFFVPPED